MNKTFDATTALADRSSDDEADTGYAGAWADSQQEQPRRHLVHNSTVPGTRKASWLYRPSSKAAWSFIAITFIQAVIGLSLQGYIFGKFTASVNPKAWTDPDVEYEARTIPVYLSLFIFGFLYQLVLVYDALRLRNTIQLVGLCLYNVGLLVEAGIEYGQVRDAVGNLSSPVPPLIDEGLWDDIRACIIAIPCLLGLATVLMFWTAYYLYREFAWSIYMSISPERKRQRAYLTYQIYIALLKFDFFFLLSFTVQFLVVVGGTSTWESRLTIAAVPVTVLLLFLAAYWTRAESVAGMLVTIFFYLAGLAYFALKLERIYSTSSPRRADYWPVHRSLTTFAGISLCLLLATIVYACMCTANFGGGRGWRGGGDAYAYGDGGNGAGDGAGDRDKLYTASLPLAGPARTRRDID